MIELFYDSYDGEMLFDIESYEKTDDAYSMILKSKYKNEVVGFQISVPAVTRKALFKSMTFFATNGQVEFAGIGEESDRFIVAIEELLKPVYKSSEKFSEEIETVDFSVINTGVYDIETDKIYLKLYNGEDQSDFEEDERITLEMNFTFNLATKRASLIEVRDGYSADLVAVLMK